MGKEPCFYAGLSVFAGQLLALVRLSRGEHPFLEGVTFHMFLSWLGSLSFSVSFNFNFRLKLGRLVIAVRLEPKKAPEPKAAAEKQ
jgi:hypothetical protein